MSLDIGVYIVKEKLPPTDVLRDVIIRAGFPCVLDDEFDPLTFNGFLLCPVNGAPSGFTYFSRELDENELKELNADFVPDLVIVLSAGRYGSEWISAAATAGSLASFTEGLLVDYLTGSQFFANDAVKWAKSQMPIRQ